MRESRYARVVRLVVGGVVWYDREDEVIDDQEQ